MPRLFSYVVLRDFGFAPNPFHGVCTLATCKPRIRATAEIGDYIVGTGTVQVFPPGQIIYAMRVTDVASFDVYWDDPRFAIKRPALNGSRKFQYGDNIYHRVGDTWVQADSHHSYPNGVQNDHNLSRDTSVDRVLFSEHFTYWGSGGPVVPDQFRARGDYDVVTDGRGHQCRFPDDLVCAFAEWLEPHLGKGFLGRPFSW